MLSRVQALAPAVAATMRMQRAGDTASCKRRENERFVLTQRNSKKILSVVLTAEVTALNRFSMGGAALNNMTRAAGVRLSGLLLTVLASIVLLTPLVAFAQAQTAAVARATSVQGAVEARRAGQSAWQPVRLND